MTTATLIKKTFNWGGLLTVSEVPSIIREHGSIQADVVLEQRVLHLQATGSQLIVTLREA